MTETEWYEDVVPRPPLLVWYEAHLFRGYHWSPEQVDFLAALEVFQHVRLLREHDASERGWALQIASAPHCGDVDAFKSLTSRIVQDGRVGQRRKDALELVSDEQRVRMIGTILVKNPGGWKKSGESGKWLAWLRSKGLTEVQAMQAADRWREKELQDPFWEE